MKESPAPREKSHRAALALDRRARSWRCVVGLAIGVAYLMAARLGLTLRTNPEGVAFFWPAAGIAVGALVVLGPRAWLPGAIAVASASVACNLLIGRNTWLVFTFALVNVAQTLLTAWLIERWFGRAIRLEDVRQVLGFLAASAAGAAIVAVGAAGAVALVDDAASPLSVLRLLFGGCLLGVVTVAPVLIGLGEAVRELPPRRELIDGAAGLAIIAALSVFVVSLPGGSWATALPVAIAFPVLLWLAVRCRPMFSAAAAFIVALVVIWSTANKMGPFGDVSAVADRILAAQTFVLAGALLAFVLAALFAERRSSEVTLKRSRERLQLALDGAELGAFSLDIATGRIECDERAAWMHGHIVLPTTIKEGRRYIHPDDRACIDNAYAAVERTGGVCRAEYRVVHAPGHLHAGETRWIVFEGSALYGALGTPVRLLGITRDITQRKNAEQALAERNVLLALAGKAALVGNYAYDINNDVMQVSESYPAIHGLPEGITESTRSEWKRRVHPDDLGRIAELRRQAFRERRGEIGTEYRIIRNGEIRWIESRSFISYGGDGQPQRVVGVNIDVTGRKQAEQALADRNTQLELAGKTAMVASFVLDIASDRLQVSSGYSTIHGFPEGTVELPRSEWRTRVHPDDLLRFESRRRQAFAERWSEYHADYRIVRSCGAVRWIEARSFISYDRDGRPQRMVGVNIDVTDRKQSEAVLKEGEARLTDALTAGQVMAFEWNAVTGQSHRSDNAAHILGFALSGTASLRHSEFLAHVHPDDRMGLKARIRALQPSSPSYALCFRFVRPDCREVWLEETGQAEFGSDGRLLRIKGLTRDITERKLLEEQKNLLIAELDHRVKNVLATVSAVAARTQETSGSMADFVKALDGRIKSMATTHELLSYRHWHGIPLAELIKREIAPYITSSNTQIDGPDVILSAEVGQAIAMVFHELATNAAKFGALSNANGHVSVRWSRRRNGRAHRWLSILWEECGGPIVPPQARCGYGTSVIRDLIPYELGGTVDLVHAPEGVRCRLEIPGHWLGGRDQPNHPSREPGLRHDSMQGS